MTVAIGMICQDGVLVASDSMGSSGMIARQVTKVHALEHHSVVWTRAGSEFVTQRAREAMIGFDEPGSPKTPSDFIPSLSSAIADAYDVPRTPPGEVDGKSEHSTELLILSWHGRPSMLHVPSDLATVDCSDRWFATIGSGHEYASAVQASLAHYSDSGVPSLAKGCLIAYRLVTAVCQVSSWGVSVPVQIAVADNDGARILSPDEMLELDTGVERWLAAERADFLGEARHRTDSNEIDLPSLGEGAAS